MNLPKLKKAILLLLFSFTIFGCADVWAVRSDNLTPKLYRAKDQTGATLQQAIEQYDIDIVVELASQKTKDSNFRDRERACKKLHVPLFQVELGAQKKPKKSALSNLAYLYQSAKCQDKNILLHYQDNAKGSSLAAAIGRIMLYDHATEDAMSEFTRWKKFLFIEFKDAEIQVIKEYDLCRKAYQKIEPKYAEFLTWCHQFYQ